MKPARPIFSPAVPSSRFARAAMAAVLFMGAMGASVAAEEKKQHLAVAGTSDKAKVPPKKDYKDVSALYAHMRELHEGWKPEGENKDSDAAFKALSEQDWFKTGDHKGLFDEKGALSRMEVAHDGKTYVFVPPDWTVAVSEAGKDSTMISVDKDPKTGAIVVRTYATPEEINKLSPKEREKLRERMKGFAGIQGHNFDHARLFPDEKFTPSGSAPPTGLKGSPAALKIANKSGEKGFDKSKLGADEYYWEGVNLHDAKGARVGYRTQVKEGQKAIFYFGSAPPDPNSNTSKSADTEWAVFTLAGKEQTHKKLFNWGQGDIVRKNDKGVMTNLVRVEVVDEKTKRKRFIYATDLSKALYAEKMKAGDKSETIEGFKLKDSKNWLVGLDGTEYTFKDNAWGLRDRSTAVADVPNAAGSVPGDTPDGDPKKKVLTAFENALTPFNDDRRNASGFSERGQTGPVWSSEMTRWKKEVALFAESGLTDHEFDRFLGQIRDGTETKVDRERALYVMRNLPQMGGTAEAKVTAERMAALEAVLKNGEGKLQGRVDAADILKHWAAGLPKDNPVYARIRATTLEQLQGKDTPVALVRQSARNLAYWQDADGLTTVMREGNVPIAGRSFAAEQVLRLGYRDGGGDAVEALQLIESGLLAKNSGLGSADKSGLLYAFQLAGSSRDDKLRASSLDAVEKIATTPSTAENPMPTVAAVEALASFAPKSWADARRLASIHHQALEKNAGGAGLSPAVLAGLAGLEKRGYAGAGVDILMQIARSDKPGMGRSEAMKAVLEYTPTSQERQGRMAKFLAETVVSGGSHAPDALKSLERIAGDKVVMTPADREAALATLLGSVKPVPATGTGEHQRLERTLKAISTLASEGDGSATEQFARAAAGSLIAFAGDDKNPKELRVQAAGAMFKLFEKKGRVPDAMITMLVKDIETPELGYFQEGVRDARKATDMNALVQGLYDQRVALTKQLVSGRNPTTALPQIVADPKSLNAASVARTLALLKENAPPGAVRYLASALQHPDPWVRQSAAFALGETGPNGKAYREYLLVAAVSDPSEEVRTAAGLALKRVDPSKDREVVYNNLPLFADEKPTARTPIVAGLIGPTQQDDGVDPLLPTDLKGAHPTVKLLFADPDDATAQKWRYLEGTRLAGLEWGNPGSQEFSKLGTDLARVMSSRDDKVRPDVRLQASLYTLRFNTDPANRRLAVETIERYMGTVPLQTQLQIVENLLAQGMNGDALSARNESGVPRLLADVVQGRYGDGGDATVLQGTALLGLNGWKAQAKRDPGKVYFGRDNSEFLQSVVPSLNRREGDALSIRLDDRAGDKIYPFLRGGAQSGTAPDQFRFLYAQLAKDPRFRSGQTPLVVDRNGIIQLKPAEPSPWSALEMMLRPGASKFGLDPFGLSGRGRNGDPASLFLSPYTLSKQNPLQPGLQMQRWNEPPSQRQWLVLPPATSKDDGEKQGPSIIWVPPRYDGN